jgi:putative membrane protein
MISWWCTAQDEPWTWAWAAYPGIWIATLLPVAYYVLAIRRRPGPLDWRRLTFFMTGMVVFWLASDWPLGPLGVGYLASAHMTQFLLYTLVAAPLILLGTPDWMAQESSRRLRIYKPAMWIGRNVVAAGLIYNVLLLATHAPGSVDALRQSQFGSFGMDVLWMVAGFVLWLPVISPLPGGRTEAPWAKMLYLFVTTSVVAVIPASYLTFTSTPIYAIYELAPRIGGITALEDQQFAGIIMKIATIPIIWSTIAVLWFRWANKEALAA